MKQDALRLVEAAPQEDDERDTRCSMMLRCQIVDGHGRRFSCFLRNISRQGLSARGRKGLRVGQKLTVVLPVIGRMEATVRWAEGSRFGLQLDDEIDAESLEFLCSPEEIEPKFRPLRQPPCDFRRPGLRSRRGVVASV